ncbi:MAG: sugar ABC transporter permease [Clostridia bacterium]|nr:sugar ABC transporter permease [Clostridia bacterium]
MKVGKIYRKKRKKTLGEIVFICVMLAIPVTHFCLFWVYINIDSIRLSFQSFDMNSGAWRYVGFMNYRTFWQELTKAESVLPKSILNSFSVFLWNDLVIVPISVICAYVLSKKLFFASGFKVIFFLPAIISVTVLTLVFSFMFDSTLGPVPILLDKLGLSSWIPFEGFFASGKTAWGMILFYGLWSGIGYDIVLVTGAITRIPEDIVEAGRIDGLTSIKEFFYITIPMIGSTIGTLLMLGTTVIFSYFLPVRLILGGDNANSVGAGTIALYIVTNVRDAGTVQMPLGAAFGIICAIIGTPIVFICRKLIDRFLPAYEY